MATAENLMAMGVAALLAQKTGITPVLVTCGGGSAGSATQMSGNNRSWYVNASNSGSGVLLPQVGGDNGVLLGDICVLTNLLGASIMVYSANNAAGSAVTIYGKGTSAAGTTGTSVAPGLPAYLQAITVSTWVGQFASV